MFLSLDEEFYQVLIDGGNFGWSQRNVGSGSDPKHQWQGVSDLMMLNADVAIMKDIQGNIYRKNKCLGKI